MVYPLDILVDVNCPLTLSTPLPQQIDGFLIVNDLYQLRKGEHEGRGVARAIARATPLPSVFLVHVLTDVG
ncbi:hypothetical protein KSD_49030 [Ktedonobacter sp. SOSP1-85]|nr:hypothetical protein KSD_49030 [Ktedonobacter sp. SOSP1-85]